MKEGTLRKKNLPRENGKLKYCHEKNEKDIN